MSARDWSPTRRWTSYGKRTVILAADLAQYLESLPDFPGQAAA